MGSTRATKVDVRLLGEHFLVCCTAYRKLPAPTLQEANWWLLDAYAWPGSVREPQNVIEWFVILSPGATIGTPAGRSLRSAVPS